LHLPPVGRKSGSNWYAKYRLADGEDVAGHPVIRLMLHQDLPPVAMPPDEPTSRGRFFVKSHHNE
jgi:hypothetical protein